MKGLLGIIGQEIGMREHEVQRIMSTAPNRYKTYEIPKRTGGTRTIAQPAREVKLLQRCVTEILLKRLPVHPCATAYRPGLSILDNAKPHSKNGPILKIDLKEFFPSIRADDWISYCKKTGCLEDEKDINLSARLLFHRKKGASVLRLAIGAPSSPILSNILMYEFDVQVVEAVSGEQIIYTRYADDMTFSAPRTGYLTRVTQNVTRVIRNLDSPRLALNPKKTTYVTKKYGRSVTGLTLANDGRVTIGREKKRKIRAAVHRAALGVLSDVDLQMLKGMLAYVNAVEPTFLTVLRNKYGAGVIEDIQKTERGRKISRHPAILAR